MSAKRFAFILSWVACILIPDVGSSKHRFESDSIKYQNIEVHFWVVVVSGHSDESPISILSRKRVIIRALLFHRAVGQPPFEYRKNGLISGLLLHWEVSRVVGFGYSAF